MNAFMSLLLVRTIVRAVYSRLNSRLILHWLLATASPGLAGLIAPRADLCCRASRRHIEMIDCCGCGRRKRKGKVLVIFHS